MQSILRYSPFAVGVFLVVLFLYGLPAEAGWFYQQFKTGTQTECDQLAANPNDPNRVGEGLAWDKLDAGQAVEACKQAVNNDPANPRYQYQYARALYKAGQHEEAVKWYRKAVEQGYVAAQAALASMYHKGRGVAQSDTEAVKWFRKAAEQGYVFAQVDLGFMYEFGKGVPEDLTEALKWYKKATKAGSKSAEKGVAAVQSKITRKSIQTSIAKSKPQAKRQYYLIEGALTCITPAHVYNYLTVLGTGLMPDPHEYKCVHNKKRVPIVLGKTDHMGGYEIVQFKNAASTFTAWTLETNTDL